MLTEGWSGSVCKDYVCNNKIYTILLLVQLKAANLTMGKQWGNHSIYINCSRTLLPCQCIVLACIKATTTGPGHHGEWWDHDRVISEQWSIDGTHDVQSQLNSYFSTFVRDNDKIIFTKLVQNNLELFLESISLSGPMLMWFKNKLTVYYIFFTHM